MHGQLPCPALQEESDLFNRLVLLCNAVSTRLAAWVPCYDLDRAPCSPCAHASHVCPALMPFNQNCFPLLAEGMKFLLSSMRTACSLCMALRKPVLNQCIGKSSVHGCAHRMGPLCERPCLHDEDGSLMMSQTWLHPNTQVRYLFAEYRKAPTHEVKQQLVRLTFCYHSVVQYFSVMMHRSPFGKCSCLSLCIPSQ